MSMVKYFIDTYIISRKKQLSRKVLLTSVVIETNVKTAHCYAEDGGGYNLSVLDIFEH